MRNSNFNLGSPRTDVCSVCLQLVEKIKMAKKERIKNGLMIQLGVHKKRAQAFFTYLKGDSLILFHMFGQKINFLKTQT